jgi:hypothetical protein
MASPHKILLFTNCEYGQANVVLAVAYELALRPNVVIHICSFPLLEKRVSWLQESLRTAGGSASSIIFHAISGLSMEEGAQNLMSLDDLPHPPGIQGAILSYERVEKIVVPWSGPEYIESYRSCIGIIKIVDPNAIVVENSISQAIDACTSLSRKFIVITPNSVREIAQQQPRLAMFWKYPVCVS